MHRLAKDKLKRIWLRYGRYFRSAAAVLVAIVVGVIFACRPLRAALPARAIPEREEGELRIHFLDVGQGDSAVVEFPDGELLLIDAGDGTFYNENKLIQYLKGLDSKKISYLATHADLDHFGGFSELFEYFPPEKVYLPALPSDSSAYSKFLEECDRSGCELSALSRYDAIAHASGAYLACVSPYAAGEGDGDDSSAVLYLNYQGVRVLFCSDISVVRERLLLREYALGEGIFDAGDYRVNLEKVDVLKVAHHGSDDSSSAEFLSLVSPREAVISCGRGNRYTHPFAGSVERLGLCGARIWRTDELGDIVVRISEEGLYNITAYCE